MQIVKTTKLRSTKHLAFVRSRACCITDRKGDNCNGGDVCAHHLTFLGGGGKGIKECDSKTVPLCHIHHSGLHFVGERSFWDGWRIDAEKIADDLASRSPSEAIRNTLTKGEYNENNI